jgi:hypothetical protein
MTENGGGQERKINDRPATANQVRDGWKELKYKCSQIESAMKKFNQATSPKSLSPDIDAFRKSCIHTPYHFLVQGEPYQAPL